MQEWLLPNSLLSSLCNYIYIFGRCINMKPYFLFFWLIRNCRHFVRSHGFNISICWQNHSNRICTHTHTHKHICISRSFFFFTLKPILYIIISDLNLYLPGFNNQSNFSQHSFAHHSWSNGFQVCSNLQNKLYMNCSFKVIRPIRHFRQNLLIDTQIYG